MKKIYVILFTGFLSFGLIAQPVAKVGLNMSTLISKDAQYENSTYNAGYFGSVGYKINMGDVMSFTPGLAYSVRGAASEYDLSFYDPFLGTLLYTYTYTMKSNIHYLEVPLDFAFNINESIGIIVSPYYGMKLGETMSVEYEDENGNTQELTVDASLGEDDAYSNSDFGIGLGVSYVINDNLMADARFTMGLMNINGAEEIADDPSTTTIDESFEPDPIKNIGIMIGVGYAIGN